jgi:hypothetical protein
MGEEKRVSRVDRRSLAGLLALAMLVVGLGGGFLVARAWTLPHPATPAFRETTGRVVALQTSPCGKKSRPGTCYQPVIDYTAEGRTLQTTAVSRYRPAPFRVGDSVPVLLGSDGTVWLRPEWEAKDAAERSEVAREKTLLFVLGSLLLGVALLGAVLVAAVLRAKATSDGATPGEFGVDDGS